MNNGGVTVTKENTSWDDMCPGVLEDDEYGGSFTFHGRINPTLGHGTNGFARLSSLNTSNHRPTVRQPYSPRGLHPSISQS